MWNSKTYNTNMIQEIFKKNTLEYNQLLVTEAKEENIVLQIIRDYIIDLFSYLPVKYDLFGSLMNQTNNNNIGVDNFQIIPEKIINRIIDYSFNLGKISGNTKRILEIYYDKNVYKKIKGGKVVW